MRHFVHRGNFRPMYNYDIGVDGGTRTSSVDNRSGRSWGVYMTERECLLSGRPHDDVMKE